MRLGVHCLYANAVYRTITVFARLGNEQCVKQATSDYTAVFRSVMQYRLVLRIRPRVKNPSGHSPELGIRTLNIHIRLRVTEPASTTNANYLDFRSTTGKEGPTVGEVFKASGTNMCTDTNNKDQHTLQIAMADTSTTIAGLGRVTKEQIQASVDRLSMYMYELLKMTANVLVHERLCERQAEHAASTTAPESAEERDIAVRTVGSGGIPAQIAQVDDTAQLAEEPVDMVAQSALPAVVGAEALEASRSSPNTPAQSRATTPAVQDNAPIAVVSVTRPRCVKDTH
jgi:hypothetical protein